MAKKKTALYFTTVAAYPGNLAMVGGHLLLEGHDPTATRLMVLNGGAWGFAADVEDVVYGMLLQTPPADKRRIVVLGREGLVRQFLSGGAGQLDTPITGKEYGYLEDLVVIANCLHACGAQGQVYRYSSGKWHAIDKGLRKKFDGEKVQRMLLSIDGFALDHIYVCGFEGEVWHWDGRRWSRIDSPTNMPLQCVLCAPDGRVYFCGAAGNLFALEKDGSWDDLTNRKVSKSTLWDMSYFRGRLYIAAEDKLLYLEKNALKAVPGPKEGSLNALAIDSSDDLLWCVGDEDVFSFDGRAWARHICPENV